MKNSEIAAVFADIADLLEMKGENPFKVRAYQRAARTIELLPRELEAMLEQGEDITAIPGIGEAIARKTGELIGTGRLAFYEDLKSTFPQGITRLLEVPSIGPKTARKLADSGISSIEDLEKAVLDGSIAQIAGLGSRTADNILQQIQALRSRDSRVPLGRALPAAEEITEALRALPGVNEIVPAGSVRRFRETVGNVDLVGSVEDSAAVIAAFVTLPQVKEVLSREETAAAVIMAGGLRVDLHITEPASFGSMLRYFTGSRRHNDLLKKKMQEKGLTLSEYGIAGESAEPERFTDEEAFFNRIGMQYIPPELREGGPELDLAERGELPRLIDVEDIRGDLHTHTDWSDGHNSIGEMAEAARRRGYEYMAVTDHSSGMGIAHGLAAERLRRQMEEIGSFNAGSRDLRLLCGIEVDIRADGTLALPDELLAELDIVVAAVHSSLSQASERLTERFLGAISNPHVDIIAHPTCRLIGSRQPAAVDLEQVYQAALKYNKALEINAMPSRLDLGSDHIYRARELGVMLTMGTDAHYSEHLDYIRFGVGTARRGWCRPQDVLNTGTLADIMKFLRKE